MKYCTLSGLSYRNLSHTPGDQKSEIKVSEGFLPCGDFEGESVPSFLLVSVVLLLTFTIPWRGGGAPPRSSPSSSHGVLVEMSVSKFPLLIRIPIILD